MKAIYEGCLFVMNDSLKSKIDVYCYMVSRGKPAAMLAVQDRYIDEAMKQITKNNLMLLVEDLCEGWKTVWIYRNAYMEEIIKCLPEEPKTAYEHWVLGKAFGYSDEVIAEFIRTIKL